MARRCRGRRIAVFAGLGAAAGAQRSALADLRYTPLQAVGALDVTVRVVALIEEVPFVGDDAGRLADSFRSTAAEVAPARRWSSGSCMPSA